MTDSHSTSSRPSCLRRLGYALTGGEGGCPRRRFFISYGVAILVLDAAAAVALPCIAGRLPSQMGMLDAVLSFLCSVCMALALLTNSLITYLPADWLLPDIPMLSGADAEPYARLYALGFYLSVPLSIAAGLVVFTLACRRLKDAGRSRWHLLAGLTPFVWAAAGYLLGQAPEVYAGHWFGFFFCHLGAFWLLYLYCRPSSTVLTTNSPTA